MTDQEKVGKVSSKERVSRLARVRRWIDARESKAGKWLGLLASLATILGVAVGFIVNDSGGESDASRSLGQARLSPVDLHVDESGENPRVIVTVHNIGSRLVVVSQATINIRRVYAIPTCFSQGDLPVSNSYGIVIPADSQPGTHIESPLHQQVGPDRADRFSLDFGIAAKGDDNLTGDYLFELDISVINDGPERQVSLGNVLVSLPYWPTPGGYYWNSETAGQLARYQSSEPLDSTWRAVMPCWQSNTDHLREALAGTAIRSARLNEVANTLVTPTFAALEAAGG